MALLAMNSECVRIGWGRRVGALLADQLRTWPDDAWLVATDRWLRLPPGILPIDLLLITADRAWLLSCRSWPDARELADDDAWWWIDGGRVRPNLLRGTAQAARGLAERLAAAGIAVPPAEAWRSGLVLVDGGPDDPADGHFHAGPTLARQLLGDAPEPIPVLAEAIESWLREHDASAALRHLHGDAHEAEPYRFNGSCTSWLSHSPTAALRCWRLGTWPTTSGARLAYHLDRRQRASAHPHLADITVSHVPSLSLLAEASAWPDVPAIGHIAALVPLTTEEIAEALIQAANGLDAAHQRGIVHQDVGAEHLLMTDEGVLVTGFLLPDMAPLTDAVDRAPEALAAWHDDALPAEDVFALAKVGRQLVGDQDSPLTPALAAATAPDPANRTATMDAFLADLRATVALPAPAAWLPADSLEPLDRTLLPIGRIVGDYRIVRHLKTGGFAQVYEAIHELQSRRVALKVYDPDVPVETLIAEFDYLAALDHPRIVRVRWSGRLPDGRPYLALDYLDGEPLSDYVRDGARLSLADIRDAGLAVLDALAYLHDPAAKPGPLAGRCLCHRDIKPGNLMRVPARGVILIDFNVAAETGTRDAFSGTRHYLPPDVARDRRPYTPDCDLYALGVTLYELACQRSPFADDGPSLHEPTLPPAAPPDAPPLSPAWAEFLARAIQPLADHRFADAKAMAAALAELPVTDRPPAVPPSSEPARQWVERLCGWASNADDNADAPAEPEPAILALAAAPAWATCAACPHGGHCVIRHNAASLADPLAGPVVRQRLADRLRLATECHGETWTPGRLRQVVAQWIGRGRTCAEVAPGVAATALAYWHWWASDTSPGEPGFVWRNRLVDHEAAVSPAVDLELADRGTASLPLLRFAGRPLAGGPLLAAAWPAPALYPLLKPWLSLEGAPAVVHLEVCR